MPNDSSPAQAAPSCSTEFWFTCCCCHPVTYGKARIGVVSEGLGWKHPGSVRGMQAAARRHEAPWPRRPASHPGACRTAEEVRATPASEG
eukprot:scaffold28973_cov118-Isochrysis_galbana.AAC.2